MADVTIRVRMNREDARASLRQLPGVIVGRLPDPSGAAEGLRMRMVNVLLSKIQQAFIVKSRGGTDEAGIRWKPLKRETIAQRRTTRGERKKLGIGGRRVRGLLTPGQDRQWRAIFRAHFAKLANQIGPKAAAGKAAAIAWAIMKSRGAKTKLDVLGGRQVEILRDTGVLFNSLSPGREDRPYSGPESDQQIREVGGSELIVGTKVAYAARQHATRPIVPKPAQIPASWWEAIGKALNRGVLAVVEKVVRGT